MDKLTYVTPTRESVDFDHELKMAQFDVVYDTACELGHASSYAAELTRMYFQRIGNIALEGTI